MKTILWGICGIGMGHCNRQIPIIEHYKEKYDIVILTYGTGLNFFKQKGFKVLEVANPYYVGDINGLNFELTKNHPNNQIDFEKINNNALSLINEDVVLVISDYEMLSAKYAYLKNIPLITLDQQSKYLVGDFPLELNKCRYRDEIERLSMFFPKVNERIAISFFKVPELKSKFKVNILPPLIKDLKKKEEGDFYLVYITGQILSEINIEKWIDILNNENLNYRIFIPKKIKIKGNNIFYHGDSSFKDSLEQCKGLISTAGHSLLSEAIFLGKPVYAIPLNLYEQQLNAFKIMEGGFGINSKNLNKKNLKEFINNNEYYKKNISEDKTILLKKGKNIFKIIDKYLVK